MAKVELKIEYTPNPNSLKFTVDRVLIEKRGKTFTKKQDAAGFPLFEKLFDAVGSGVQSIFCVNNFFTITQNGTLDWPSAMGKIEQVVTEHFDGVT
jgi:hypothetical protein